VLGTDRDCAAARAEGGLAGLIDDRALTLSHRARETSGCWLGWTELGAETSISMRCCRRLAWSTPRDRGSAAFSLGMRQRLGLAAALMRRPALLLLDEPAKRARPVGADELWRVCGGSPPRVRPCCCLATDLAAIDDVCDEITVLRQGAVAWSGATAELRALAPAPEHVLSTDDDSRPSNSPARGRSPRRVGGGLRVTAAGDELARFTIELGQSANRDPTR